MVVVGSGYGGSIAASRLARAGQRVCLLERGRELRPGEFPTTVSQALEQFQVSGPDGHVGSPLGLYDLRVNRGMSVFVGCGLGGTSLVNGERGTDRRAAGIPYMDPTWGLHAPSLLPRALALCVLMSHWECDSMTCRMVSFTYGSGHPALWRHENLNAETHGDWLDGNFGFVPLSFFAQIHCCVEYGHLVSVSGLPELPASFVAQPPKTDARFALFAGELNQCFSAESQRRTFAFLDAWQPGRHSVHVIPGYRGHEHSLAVYQDGLERVARARLVGCSAFEMVSGDDPYRVVFTDVPYAQHPAVQLSVVDGRYSHGVPVIDLGKAQVEYYELPARSPKPATAPADPPEPLALIYQEDL